MLLLSCFRLLFLDPACSSISITQHAVLSPLTLTCFKAFRCDAGKQPGCGMAAWGVMHKAAAISTYDAATPCTLAAIGTGHLSSTPASRGVVRCAIPPKRCYGQDQPSQAAIVSCQLTQPLAAARQGATPSATVTMQGHLLLLLCHTAPLPGKAAKHQGSSCSQAGSPPQGPGSRV